MKKFGNIIALFITFLLIIAIIVAFLRNFTFGFEHLFLVLILFMWIIGIRNNEFKMHRNWALATSVLLVVSFGALCLIALNNYVNPSKEVFANSDHHAIALEGVHIDDTKGFKLVSSSRESFFDTKVSVGEITLNSLRQEVINGHDTVKVIPFSKKGFSVPIYSRRRESRGLMKEDIYFRDIDDESNEVFSSGDEIILTQEGTTVSFCVKEDSDAHSSTYTLRYISNGKEVVDTSSFRAYLRRSYPLSYIFQNTDIDGFCLDGITLYRTVFFDTQISNPQKTYNRLGAKYRLGLTLNSHDTELKPAVSKMTVQVNGYSYNLSSSNGSSEFVADGKTVYAIGTLEDEIPQFRLYPEKSGISLRYRMPQYRILSSIGNYENAKGEEMSFMLATSIMNEDGTINDLLPENVLLFDQFDYQNNRYHMIPSYISFVKGATTDLLAMSVASSDGKELGSRLKAGDTFPEFKSRKGGLNWIISLDDFKNPSIVRPGEIERPMSTKTMAIIIIAVTLMSVLLMFVTSGHNTNGRRTITYSYTYVEALVYLVLLGFLTIRLFLLWRISVFPPVISTSVTEFNGIYRHPSTLLLMGSSSLTWIVRLLAVFYAGILITKLWVLRSQSSLQSWLYSEFTDCNEDCLKKWFILLATAVPFAIILLAVLMKFMHVTNRFCCILLPLILFFITDFVSNKLYGGYYRKSCHTDLRYLWILIFNSIGATIYCFIMDGGFGIIFLLFSVLNILIRLIDAFLYKGRDAETQRVYINKWIYGLSILALLFIRFSKQILLLLLDGPIFAIVLFLLLTAVFVIILLAFQIIQFSAGKPVLDKKAWIVTSCGLIVIAIISTASLLAPSFYEGKHIEYRLRVQSEKPGEVLLKLNSATAERKFMEASINDWILGEYEARGKNVSAFIGEHGHGYFKLQPQSKVGALWGAQTTDIALSRYIIAEHGRFFAIMLVAVLGLLLFLCVRFASNRVWSKALITQIPLFLSVQALLVWMAVTQKFFFLGQDFPMISITSNITSFVFIGLMMILVMAAVTESSFVKNGNNDLPIIASGNHQLAVHILVFSTFVFLWLILIGNKRKEQFYDAKHYDVKESIERLRKLADSVNDGFVAFQETYLNKNCNDISKILGSPHDALEAYLKTDDDIITSFNSQDDFCSMAFSRFRESMSIKNDINGLMYIAKKKRRDENNALKVIYELKVNDMYYARSLPRSLNDSWKGSLVSMPLDVNPTNTPSISENEGYTIYTLPREWTGIKDHTNIVKSKSDGLKIVDKFKPLSLQKGKSAVIAETDKLMENGKDVSLSRFGGVSYLAKNIIINGSPAFVYPIQEKLYWLRPFAMGVRKDMSENMDGKIIADKDVYLTLSPELTSSIYDAVNKERNGKMTAAIVADGEGNIISMLDLRDKSHRMNPNDSKSINRKTNELILEGEYNWGNEGENYFGNKALANLRFGPGSSQKPLVWTAVTTVYNNPSLWKDLRLAKINPFLMAKTESNFSAQYIAGTQLSPGKKKTYFRSISNDEGNGTKDVDLSSYIYKSSNYYNAIMAFFGSYSREKLAANFSQGSDAQGLLFNSIENKLITSNKKSDEQIYRMSFPIMRIKDSLKSFKTIPSIPKLENADSSTLVVGLYSNLGLEGDKGTHRPVIYSFKSINSADKFALPDESRFLNKYRISPNNTTRADNAIKYTAIGAASVWQVSPLIMAQMYGKMISLNKNYVLSLEPSKYGIKSYDSFDIDNVQEGYDNLGCYSEIRNIFEKAMSDVFFNAQGTAKGVIDTLCKIGAKGYRCDRENSQLLAISPKDEEKKLFLYGKTGTINGTAYDGDGHKKDAQDHILAVVITDTKLESTNEFEKYKKMKFYVIYIADFDTRDWIKSDASVIRAVLESKEFKTYMNIK